MENSNVFSVNSVSPVIPWTRSASSSNPTRTIATKTLAIFRLADNWFGVDIACIERVVPTDYVALLTPARGAVLGTVGIGSRLVSVVDLRLMLGIGRSRQESQGSVLVTRSPSELDDRNGHQEIGILADEFEDVFFIPIRQIVHYSDDCDSAIKRVIAGECICGGRVISVVSVEGVIESLATAAAA
jgi:chemotaxis signal transduction protein